ncbi:FeoA family protein [Velocimicrobium porci]|uniref:Ferrous iron transport protein A n=1 Tax=Velocimicrobium porci TaxID=2606634 RepID=A0A6L5XUH7_9FIRM|nr:FeoA family protein [Velocimicrobium porci]MSS62466.1 ferrous iron transport protein A [Velocimicrobium porci]
MTLLEGKIGESYKVEDLTLNGMTQIRLEALGLTKGTTIKVLNNKKSGSVIFMVRGTRLAIGKKIAASIVIEGV